MWILVGIGLFILYVLFSDQGKPSSTTTASSRRPTPAYDSATGLPLCARCHKPFSPRESYHKYCTTCYRLRKLGVINKPLDKMSGEEFERALYDAFTKNGYNVELTEKTGDHGADLIISRGLGRVAIQAKRYDPSRNVGIGAVRDIYSAMKFYNCDQAWVITTSFFTMQAKEEADKLGVRLIDRNALQGMLPSLFMKFSPQKKQDESVSHPTSPSTQRVSLRCPNCSTKNRVKTERIERAKCGKCGAKLTSSPMD